MMKRPRHNSTRQLNLFHPRLKTPRWRELPRSTRRRTRQLLVELLVSAAVRGDAPEVGHEQ